MSKPEDIPQDVWDEAFDHMDCHCPEAMMGDDDLQQSVHAAIARSILAAKAEEREAIASMLNDPGIDIKDRFAAVELVRKRGEVNTAHKNSEVQ